MQINERKLLIAMARKKFNISRLAEAYGVSKTRMSQIMKNKEVSTECIGRLAEALGVDVTELLED